MPRPDFRGARGSNAGDDFHELWALRQALTLLDFETDLAGMTVEGLLAQDEGSSTPEAWDGVDCALYFNGDSAASAERIDLIQFKYSSSDPDAKWTVARLVRRTAKKSNNSILRRMSDAFEGVRVIRKGGADGVRVRLISNQPIDPLVVGLFANVAVGINAANSSGREKEELAKAAGLKADDFRRFASAVELSQAGSRFDLEENVLRTIAAWTEGDARPILNDLLQFIRRAMMPESKGKWIRRETLLAHFGFSDFRALFPCRPQISAVANPIPRETSSRVVADMLGGQKYICMHGVAGCGKTTAIEEIKALLTAGSVMLVFDCYGGGRYLDSDAHRHLPKDAFLQLSNDLAVRLRVPLLLTRSDDANYARAFHGRLAKAAEVVRASTADALLVIAVDAADNSVTAAQRMVPAERSFVHDFVALGDIPDNVRLVVTSRSGRLTQLDLPHNFRTIEIDGFTRPETGAHVRTVWADAPAAWTDDFHYLSRGNPRVQHYAFTQVADQPQNALSLLLPRGKLLNDVFQIQLDEARKKAGKDQPLDDFCAALTVLPRPVPLPELSGVSGLTESELADVCADLVPGIRLTKEGVGFADEDFEDFIRTKSPDELAPIRARVADRFSQRHRADQYAAIHLAAALHAAGRGREIIDLMEAEAEAPAIGDTILRRDVRLQRLQIAMQVSAETNDQSLMLRTILVGAEAMRSDAAIFDLIVKHPDLAAAFMRDSAARRLLLDARQVSQHGGLLFHLMLDDARSENAIGARETRRQLWAWLERRRREIDQQEHDQKHNKAQVLHQPDDWAITSTEIAAQVETALLLEGPRAAVATLKNWKPRRVNLTAGRIVVQRLISSGRADLVDAILSENLIPDPWNLFLLVPLAIDGRTIDLKRLEHCLNRIRRRGWVRLEQLGAFSQDEFPAFWLDSILAACEVLVARGGDRKLAKSLLELFSDPAYRQIDRLYPSQGLLIDIEIRALSLLVRLDGRGLTIDEFLVTPPVQKAGPGDGARGVESQHREEIRQFVRPLIGLYDARAQLLAGVAPPMDSQDLLSAALGAFETDYHFSRMPDAFEMRRKAAVAVSSLRCVVSIDSSALLNRSLEVFGQRLSLFGGDELAVLPLFASDSTLHNDILKIIAKRVEEIGKERTVASEKIDAILKIARFVCNISRGEAAALFNSAHKMSEEIDVEAVHQLRAVASMAIRAAPVMEADKRRKACQRLHSIVTDAAIRLSGQDGFPWDHVVEALVLLDLPMALACISRWQDSNTQDLDSTLPSVLQIALDAHLISSKMAVALLPLVSRLDSESLKTIPAGLTELPSKERATVVEELARDELLRFRAAYDAAISRILRQCCFPSEQPGPWARSLEATTAFLDAEGKEPGSRANVPGHAKKNPAAAPPVQLPAGLRFVSPEEIVQTLSGQMANARSSQQFVYRDDVMRAIRRSVGVVDRVAHLNALAAIRSDDVHEYLIADAISEAIGDDEWGLAASVREWCTTRLPGVIVDRLPGFAQGLGYGGRSPLPPLLALLAGEGKDIPTLLAEAIGAHVDDLGAEVVFELARLIAERMKPDHAAGALLRYLERMNQRIPPADLDQIDIGDVPAGGSAAIARLLFSLMSDCDVRIRWRAAHCVRRLAALSLTEPLDTLVSLYNRTSEGAFRAANEPFYWLAARLSSVIALNRIAHESPNAIARHAAKLFSIATDESFPHVLIRAFAKDAALHLLDSGHLKLNAKDRRSLVAANTGSVPRKRGSRTARPSGAPGDKIQRERAFHFDSLDTVPYWYGPAIDVFADVTQEEFLDAAENWIVGNWRAPPGVSRWDAQPRRYRFSDRDWQQSTNDHGSDPTLEHFSTYLERHAMFCAVGELMQSRALVQPAEAWNDNLESWLRRWYLSAPPFWLADFRGPKPLEQRFWLDPPSVTAWLEAPPDSDFLSELGFGARRDGMMVVQAWHDTGSSHFSSRVLVGSALVSPATAAALMRALQSAKDPYDYKLPDYGEDFEIDAAPYRLLGWLENASISSRADAKDPLRRSISGICLRPGVEVAKGLIERAGQHGAVTWQTPDGSVIFEHNGWSDKRDDERSDRGRRSFESDGERLWMSTKDLQDYMLEREMDLIVSVEFIMEEGDGGYQAHDKKKRTARKAKVILLRRDGGIEDCNGRIGTWEDPRDGAKARRTARHPGKVASPPRR